MTAPLLMVGNTFKLLHTVKADHHVCDPPFSEFVHANLRGNLTDQTVIVPRKAGYNALTAKDRRALAHHWIGAEIAGWHVWFSDWESVGEWRALIEQAGGVWGRAIPWVRWSKPVGPHSIPSGSEAVCFARRKGSKPPFNGRGRTHYAVKCLRHQSREATGYNGQKPVALMREILQDVAQPGQTVVDDHCGTGSTLIAAHDLGMASVGIEFNTTALEHARKRLANLP